MALQLSFHNAPVSLPSPLPPSPLSLSFSTAESQTLLSLCSLSRSPSRTRSVLRASRRFIPGRPPQVAVLVSPDSRAWLEMGGGDGDKGDFSDDDGGDEDDRSLDLFVRFLHNLFSKVSRRVRRAARSVLPASIPTRLVRFSVDGSLILSFLWILKALLEVICSFGTMIFVSILLVRGVWSVASYMQENRLARGNRFGYHDNDWSGAQPVT